MSETKQKGRPAKPIDAKRRNRVTFCLTDAELEGLRNEAAYYGCPVSFWLRWRTLRRTGTTTVDGRWAIESDAIPALIAAAPELLEALKALIDNVGSCICYDESERECKAWEMAEAAIAKAKGEQP